MLAAFAAYFLLGALWYVVLFSQTYKMSLGKANEVLNNELALFVVGPGGCGLAAVLATTLLFSALHITPCGDTISTNSLGTWLLFDHPNTPKSCRAPKK
jgi:hypothetical protein